jgi:hypothetical protein
MTMAHVPHLGKEPDWDKRQWGENQGDHNAQELHTVQAAWAQARQTPTSREHG